MNHLFSSVRLTTKVAELIKISQRNQHVHAHGKNFPLRHSHGKVQWKPAEPLSRLVLPLNLIFVRHGESEGNLAQRASKKGDDTLWNTTGFSNRYTSNYRLTTKGRDQAHASGQWLLQNFPELSASPVPSSPSSGEHSAPIRYYCSEYIRAQETAAHLGLPHAHWTVSYALREREKGIGYGSSNSERKKRQGADAPISVTWNDLYRFKDDEPFYWSPTGGGGESIANVCQRFELFLSTAFLYGTVPKSTFIVAHGNLMRAARVVLEHMTQAMFKEMESSTEELADIKNCQIFQYSRQNPHSPSDPPSSAFRWMRSLCPYDLVPGSDQWHEIAWPTFTNQQLLEHCESVPQLVDQKDYNNKK